MKHRPAVSFALLVLASGGVAMAAGEASQPASRPTMKAWVKDRKPSQQTVRLLADLPGFEAGAVKLDRFGGNSAVELKATGFFRTEKVGERWWLVTPGGHPYFSIGLNSVAVREGSPTVKAAFAATFASDEKWRDAVIEQLLGHGFNATANWSNNDLLAGAAKRMPYHFGVNFMASYGQRRGGTRALPGRTGYPNDCMFVFDPEFPAYCETLARSLVSYRDDPYLVGYFSDNELPFRMNSLDLYLKNPEDDAGRKAAEAFLAARRGAGASPESITDDDRQAWMEVLAEKYFSIVSTAIRKVDANHLYLGSRFHSSDHRNPALMRTAGKYVDVISYNLYNVFDPDVALFRRWAEWSGKPSMITEFYAKGADSGLDNMSGAGWTVATQADRGRFYQTFVLGLIESRACVGWHWLRYIDNAPDDKLADPSNRDSNKGIVNSKFVPYGPLLEQMKAMNDATYQAAAYFDARAGTDKSPERK